MACALLGATNAADGGSLLGPLCVVLVCAREVYWFGLESRVDAVGTMICFAVVLALRGDLVRTGIDYDAGNASTGTNARDVSTLRENELQWLNRWQELQLPPYTGSVPPVGPALPLSFILSATTGVLACAKAIDPIPDDLNEVVGFPDDPEEDAEEEPEAVTVQK